MPWRELESGEPGSARQAIKDAANGDVEELGDAERRMFVALANHQDLMNKKLSRATTLLISTTISLGLVAAGVWGNLVF